MRIQSPINDLTETLARVKVSANQYRSTLTGNEAATRAALIDPILRALGWDTANVDVVEVEKISPHTKDTADYALYDTNGNLCLVIEAKFLGGNLNDPKIEQALLRYAYAFQPQGIFLTDGLIWKHFTNFQAANFVPSKIVDIDKDNLIECATYFVQWLDAAKFWPSQQSVDVLAQQIAQLQSDLSTLQKAVSSLAQINAPKQSPVISSPATPQANYIDLDTLVGQVSGTKPSSLRLPDGSMLPVKTWRDVLRESCKFALANNSSISLPFPDKAGRKIHLFDTIKPSTGAYVTEQYNGQQIYIYLLYDANYSVANAVHVLSLVPAAKKIVKAAVVYGRVVE